MELRDCLLTTSWRPRSSASKDPYSAAELLALLRFATAGKEEVEEGEARGGPDAVETVVVRKPCRGPVPLCEAAVEGVGAEARREGSTAEAPGTRPCRSAAAPFPLEVRMSDSDEVRSAECPRADRSKEVCLAGALASSLAEAEATGSDALSFPLEEGGAEAPP